MVAEIRTNHMTWGFKILTMEFNVNGEPCKFVGEIVKEMKFLESKDVKKPSLAGKYNFLLQICSIDGYV